MTKVKTRKTQSGTGKKLALEKKVKSPEPVAVPASNPLKPTFNASPTPSVLTSLAPLKTNQGEVYFELDTLKSLEGRLKRKDTLLQEQQKKIRSLKQRITRLEEEARNRNRTIVGYQGELLQLNKSSEDRIDQLKAAEMHIDELCKRLETLQKEKLHGEENRQSLLGENQNFKEKEARLTEERNNLKQDLKQRAQEMAATGRELKEVKRVYRELQESFDILLDQNTGLDRQNTEMKRMREEMETRYTRTLDNLKGEVRIRQSECSKLLHDLQDLKREREDLERLVDGIELKTEMLTSNNATLQRRLDRVLWEKAQQDALLKSRFVRVALSLASLFGRLTATKETTSITDERTQGF